MGLIDPAAGILLGTFLASALRLLFGKDHVDWRVYVASGALSTFIVASALNHKW